jgi:anti-sigma regulatory factor (Ser/Thr protein kinase)
MNRDEEQAVLDTVAAPGNLADVMRFVRDRCARPGQETGPLDLIVEELFLNIAMHACPDEPVRIGCFTPPASGLASLEFVYSGPAFDPTAQAPPPGLDASLADRRVGGLGLFLVRQMAESVTYRREGELNRLGVTVRLE